MVSTSDSTPRQKCVVLQLFADASSEAGVSHPQLSLGQQCSVTINIATPIVEGYCCEPIVARNLSARMKSCRRFCAYDLNPRCDIS